MKWKDSYVEKHFGFLTEKGFSGPFIYMHDKVIRTDFVKNNIVVNIAYDGLYIISLLKINIYDKQLALGNKRSSDLLPSEYYSFDISILDSKKKIYGSINSKDIYNCKLSYYAELFKRNPELLEGDLKKLKRSYKVFRKLTLRA